MFGPTQLITYFKYFEGDDGCSVVPFPLILIVIYRNEMGELDVWQR